MSNKTYRQLLRDAEQVLQKAFVEDATFEARCLLEYVSGYNRSELVFHYADVVPDSVEDLYLSKLQVRLSGQPLQYVLGEWDFMGYTFDVQPGVLIPRPETEFLADWAVKHLPNNAIVYDVCAGTGCIGISVALQRKDVQVFLFEKYDVPFQTLQKNILRHNAQNVTAIRCDLFEGVPDGVPAPQMILSNPPYICTSELATLQIEVQQEPMEALDGGEDGLIFYRALREQWFPILSDGCLAMECGEGQCADIASLFPSESEIFKDYIGTERFVIAYTQEKR